MKMANWNQTQQNGGSPKKRKHHQTLTNAVGGVWAQD